MDELIDEVRLALAAWEYWFGPPLIPLVLVPLAWNLLGARIVLKAVRVLMLEPGRRP